jgi:hypothetical protein
VEVTDEGPVASVLCHADSRRDGVPQVGVQLTCNPGSWSPPSVNDTIDATDYSWFNGATLVHDGVCKVIFLSPGSHLVSVDISRGRKTYATGTAVVRGGVAKLRLDLRGRFHHGTYLITLVTTDGTKAMVIRLHKRL